MMDMAESANRVYAIKTTAKQERTVADNIEKVTREQKDIHVMAVMVPEELKGYVLVESPDSIARIEQLVELIPHARAVVQGSTALSEVEHFLVPKPVVSGITEGTIVEIIAGPFKGEKAVVKRIDTGKEEITVELYESMVPIRPRRGAVGRRQLNNIPSLFFLPGHGSLHRRRYDSQRLGAPPRAGGPGAGAEPPGTIL
jgi:transcriptional antiterminator NusG